MTVSAAQVAHVAALAKLRFDPDGHQRMAQELTQIIQYVNVLGKLSLDDIPPTSHPLNPETNVLRPDEVRPSLPRAAALAAAPASSEGLFRVPRVVEG